MPAEDAPPTVPPLVFQGLVTDLTPVAGLTRMRVCPLVDPEPFPDAEAATDQVLAAPAR
jgi:hypothetical protein